jgi:Fur family transcriptional regulator, ferric uptake regulator
MLRLPARSRAGTNFVGIIAEIAPPLNAAPPTGITMSSPEDLKTIGLKATLPRLRILELFEKSDIRHLAAEDVYKKLVEEGTDTGLATVYRVLTQFEQAGLLTRHHFESGKAVYELNQGGHHDHLVCLQCGHVEEFYDAEIEKRQEKVAKDRGFRIHDHSLHIYADCTKTDCPRKSST